MPVHPFLTLEVIPMLSVYAKIESYLSGQHTPEAEELLHELRAVKRGVRVIQDYNLRWNKEAVESHDWTVFVNRRGSLAHAVLFDKPDVMVRLPGLNLKGCHEEYARKVLTERLEGL